MREECKMTLREAFLGKSYEAMDTYLIFVTDATDIVRGENFVMWRHFRCGPILDVEKH